MDEYKDIVLLFANYLLNHSTSKNDLVYWSFSFDYPVFGMYTPWASGLTNAWCSLALLYAAILEPENSDIYSKKAEQGLKYLFVLLKDGGALGSWDDVSIWFEVYPNNSNLSHVLNGYIFILEVLHIFNMHDRNIKYQVYYELGFQNLKKN